MDTITNFLDQKKASGLSKSTIKSYRMILTRLNDFKPVDEIGKDDLVRFFNKPFQSEATKFLYVVSVKNFFKEIGKPELIAWLKAKRPKETLTSDDILTSNEVQAMIDATDSHYWKALIALLYETGGRISEIQLLKWKDLAMGEYTMKDNGIEKNIKAFMVHIPTQKTAAGFRKMLLPYSTSYLLNLMEMAEHNPVNKIFYSSYKHHYDIIGEIGRRAKIGKHVHPHLLRHSRATAEIQKGISEPLVRKMMGWSNASTVPSRYIHLSDNDVIDSQLGIAHNVKNGNIRIAEKVDVKTTYDEMAKLSEELQQEKAKREKLEKDMEKIQEFISLGGLNLLKK